MSNAESTDVCRALASLDRPCLEVTILRSDKLAASEPWSGRSIAMKSLGIFMVLVTSRLLPIGDDQFWVEDYYTYLFMIFMISPKFWWITTVDQ